MASQFEDFLNAIIEDDKENLFGDQSKIVAFMVFQAMKTFFKQDFVENSLITIDHSHAEIHEGHFFFHENLSSILAGQSKTFLIVLNNDCYAHSFLQVSGTGETQLLVQENVTASGNGTPLQVLNRDRNSSEVNCVQVFSDPTGVSTTNAITVRTPRSGIGKVSPAETRSENELILKKNTKYLVTITNQSNQTSFITSLFNWYEA